MEFSDMRIANAMEAEDIRDDAASIVKERELKHANNKAKKMAKKVAIL
jgi:hypothetical protein